MFSNTLSIDFDTNTWITSLTTQLMSVITTNGLMISEDITLIHTLLDNQLDSNKSLFFKFNKYTVLSVVSVTTSLLWFGSSVVSIGSVLTSLFCGICLPLSSLTYSFASKIYIKHRLLQKIHVLCESQVKVNDIFNKYLKLIEDNEVLESGGQHSRRLCDMRDRFRHLCWKCFIIFRDKTIYLRQTFAINKDIDEENNFLCCFPIESFDKFKSEDKTVINVLLLKSLKQLKRLQSSEFLRRFSRDLKQTNLSLEMNNVLNINRNIRRNLLTALNKSEEFDSLFESHYKSTDFRHLYRQQIDSFNNELNKINESIISLEKLLRIDELKERKSDLMHINKENNLDNNKIVNITTIVDEYIIKDQVFEAFVTQEADDNNDNITENDSELWEEKCKLIQETEDSNNLYKELKIALKSKAEEHQQREAKALGIDVNHLKDDFKDNIICDTKPDESINSNKYDIKTSVVSEDKINTNQLNQSFQSNSFVSFGFISQIAAQKAINFGLNTETECFGDNCNDSESDSSDE
ncbi:uncharacterized protein LOC128961496 [Oppia nitens]|uniref:uncharacterized protein LOC128961496 n=1 Tax=Oppia nitens TaxID=1686743 RepID=UPI0023DC68B8|nr:uncharacterized protein LOC128961496 [Oppia nitens]